MKRLFSSQIAIAACAVLAFGVSSPTIASADSYSTFDVNATYDNGAGTLTGSFTLDTTTNTSYAVDLTIVGVGGVTSATFTDPTIFGTGTYPTAEGSMPTYNNNDISDEVDLTYPAGGGELYVEYQGNGFGHAQISSEFSPTCTGQICSYELYGTVLASGVAATPLPAALPLFAGGLGLIGFISRRRKQKNITLAA
jgi:hypothetical protein